METPAATITRKMIRSMSTDHAKRKVAIRFEAKADETLAEFRYQRRTAILAKENERAARTLGSTTDAIMAHDVAQRANEMAAAWLEWYNAYICASEAIALDGLDIESAMQRAVREFQSGDAAEWFTEALNIAKE